MCYDNVRTNLVQNNTPGQSVLSPDWPGIQRPSHHLKTSYHVDWPRGRSRERPDYFLPLYLVTYPCAPSDWWLSTSHELQVGQITRLWLMSLFTASRLIAKISVHRFCTETPTSHFAQFCGIKPQVNRWNITWMKTIHGRKQHLR